MGLYHIVREPCWDRPQLLINGRYGFFQEYYVKTLGASPANASWIGAMQMFLVHFLATLSGRWMDAGYLRQCIALGCLFQVAGALATSFGTQLWHFWLAQGILSGTGHGLVFSPMISLYATYFSTKRVMAVSLASCGAATGGMVFPVVAYKCFDTIGFAWTVRIMAAIILANSAFIVKFTKSRIIPRSMPPWVDFSAFRERSYLLFSIGSFLIFEGIYFAYIYVSLVYLWKHEAKAGHRSDNMLRFIPGSLRAIHFSF